MISAGKTMSVNAHDLRGFTLLEVLVAVAILATALSAVVAAGANYADGAGYLREKTQALWVAHNRMTEIELQPTWPAIGKSDDDVRVGGIDWRWHVEIKTTQDPNLRRIDISVERGDDKRKNRSAYAQLSGFTSNVAHQSQQQQQLQR